MIDNIMLAMDFSPPKELSEAGYMPVKYAGVLYHPEYTNGELFRYRGKLNNLMLFVYPSRVILCNSLHKYGLGNNHSDFTLTEINKAVDTLCDDTGINWLPAAVKKLEYGCNIPADAQALASSLAMYKGRQYLPMQAKGKVYGAVCEFGDYKVKGYDKAFEVKHSDRVNLNIPLFRWEIAHKRVRTVESHICSAPLTLNKLLKPEALHVLANDAVQKYEKTIKLHNVNYGKLGQHEVRVVATMSNPQARECMRKFHPVTYYRDLRAFKEIMAEQNLCEPDCTARVLELKFEELISL